MQHGPPSYEPPPVSAAGNVGSSRIEPVRPAFASGLLRTGPQRSPTQTAIRQAEVRSVASDDMANIPDEPTLDGIEARWAERWEADGTYHFDRTRRARPRCSRSTRRRRPCQRLAAHGPRVQLHPHRHRRPLPAHARQAGLLPDGLGRQRPADRAARAELLRRPLRPERSRTTPASSRRSGRRRRRITARSPISRPNFVELCDELIDDRRGGFEALFRRLGLSVDWTLQVHDHRRALAAAPASAAFLRNLARGEAYSQDAPTLWDVDYRTAVAQAEMEDRERAGRLPQARASTRHRRRRCDRDRHDPARAARRAASRSSPTPTTSATSRCSAPRCARRCSASRCPCSPTSSPSPTRAPASP